MLNPQKFRASWDGWLLYDKTQSEFMLNTSLLLWFLLFCFCIILHVGTTVMLSRLHSEWRQCLESGEWWTSMNSPLGYELHEVRDHIWFVHCYILSTQHSVWHMIYCWMNKFRILSSIKASMEGDNNRPQGPLPYEHTDSKHTPIYTYCVYFSICPRCPWIGFLSIPQHPKIHECMNSI